MRVVEVLTSRGYGNWINDAQTKCRIYRGISSIIRSVFERTRPYSSAPLDAKGQTSTLCTGHALTHAKSAERYAGARHVPIPPPIHTGRDACIIYFRRRRRRSRIVRALYYIFIGCRIGRTFRLCIIIIISCVCTRSALSRFSIVASSSRVRAGVVRARGAIAER